MPEFDIARTIRELALLAVPFLAAITVHEAAHGWVAWKLGDPTAKDAGRLTLNPFKHLDPIGTLVLVLTRMIGWAKPVPVDPRNFRDPLKGNMLVSLAGPAANLLLSLGFAAMLHGLFAFFEGREVGETTAMVIQPAVTMLYLGVQLNLALCIFNLLPIPPLDGSGIMAGLLPRHMAARYLALSRYGFIAVILLAMTGLLGTILGTPVRFLLNLLTP